MHTADGSWAITIHLLSGICLRSALSITALGYCSISHWTSRASVLQRAEHHVEHGNRSHVGKAVPQPPTFGRSQLRSGQRARYPDSPGVAFLALASLVGNAQKTNATCYSGYSWMNNERGQSPCLVASYLLSPCSTSSEGVVIPALNDSHSLYNFAETSLADTPCVCSTVTFSMLYACATCQGAELAIIPWYIASENCTQRYLLSYPEIIPRDTSIPYWAYDPNVGITGRLDIATAKQESSEGEYENPDATLSGAYSGGPTSYNPYGNSPYDPGAYEGEQLAGDGQGTSVGVIVGAVVGGSVGVIAAVSIAILLVRRSRHRRTRGTPVGTDVGGPAVPSKGDSFAAGSTAKLYDPDDPTTYPGVMPSLAPTSDKTAPQLSYTGRPEV